jgi:hypothetical protein
MNPYSSIPGSEKLLQWFEGVPSFHDAEVLEFHLDRTGKSWIRILTTYKPATVIFTLEGITDLELCDFSCQNVIFDLHLESRNNVFRLTMAPCYGIAGFIEAEKIGVDIAPSA